MKRILVGVLPLFFCICFRVLAIAQANSDPMKAWIELELHDGDAKIRALFFNASNQTQTLSYTLQVAHTGKNGTARNAQAGPFTVLPDETKILSKASFYAENRSHYKIVLKIFDEVELILSDSLVYGKNPIDIQTTKAIAKKEKTPKVLVKPPTPIKSNTAKEQVVIVPKEKKAIEKKVKKTIAPPPVSANKPVVKQSFDNLEIDGLIIDETRSKIARDFYDSFYSRWIAPQSASNFSILIKELPSRGRGARVSILVNDDEVFQRFVPPNYETIQVVVNYAINRIRQYLQKNEDLKKQLLNEDQKGSGIF